METTLSVKQGKYRYKLPVKLEITESRIKFLRSSFKLKDEIKSMRGPRWHGFDKEDPQKIWSVENHPRNVFRLRYLMGENVYAHFEQELCELPDFRLKDIALEHQKDMVRRVLTYHFQILAAEQGLGKSMVAIIMAELKRGRWWYVGPKSAGESFTLELEKWECDNDLFEEILTYEALEKKVRYAEFPVPTGIIFDESTAIKNANTNRAKAAQAMADYIRKETENKGYVVLLSGTPTAKSPSDIWSQAEVAWPGFLREGSEHAFKQRYAFMEEQTNMDGVKFMKQLGWNEAEVSKLPNRLNGLMTTYRKVDWLDLPSKRFRRVHLEPSKKVLRVAKALVSVAKNSAIALTWLRALSSGFQYIMVENGQKECPSCNMMPIGHDCPVCQGTRLMATKERQQRLVKTPKEDALRVEMAGENRIIVPASFTGSIDRCQKIAHEEGFAICRVDGRGWFSFDKGGDIVKGMHPMRWWKECSDPVAFIGNPGSCKFGLTLTEARKMVFFDNDFSAENRLQMIDRFHRIGQTQSPEVVDLIHLPVDEKVLDTLENNRNLELISLGSLAELLGDEAAEDIDLSLE